MNKIDPQEITSKFYCRFFKELRTGCTHGKKRLKHRTFINTSVFTLTMEIQTICEQLARQAGKIIRENFEKPMKKDWKSDNTPVTITDTEINRLVIETIKQHFPSHDIRGEEESDLSNNSSHVWLCDPVDGTIPFSHGIPTACFSLALVEDGIPKAGIIYDPWMDRLYYAEQGKGTTLNGKTIHVNAIDDLQKAVIGVATWRQAPHPMHDIYETIFSRDMMLVQLASIVYMGMLVASGELSGVCFSGKTAHDVAALKIIIEEAGGKVTDIYGNDQRYNDTVKGCIATNGIIHDLLIRDLS
jgi:fructose-1,6-bisphosphatase/inositol monophosphatase family enzyme